MLAWVQVDAARRERAWAPTIGSVPGQRSGHHPQRRQAHQRALLLEPQPASAALFPLCYTALRRQLSLPVLVLVGSAEAVDFHYADVLVLKAWPQAGESLESYQARINDLIAPFLRAGEQAQGKSMVALSGKLETASPAAPFFEAGRKALNANLDKAPTSYLGYSVHGLLPLADGSQTDLEPEVWRLLSLPVAGP